MRLVSYLLFEPFFWKELGVRGNSAGFPKREGGSKS